MNKMLVWFHAFPEMPQGEDDYQDLSQIKLTVFKPAENNLSEQIFSGSLAEFIDFVLQEKSFNEAEIILPAEVVLYTQVSVPSKSKNRILQALPFILDDSLINNTDKQHFALGDVKAGQCHIAILSHAVMKTIIKQFSELSLSISCISSENFQLPWQENQWSIGFINTKVIIRTGRQSGVVNNIEDTNFVLRLLLNEQLAEDSSADSGHDDIDTDDPDMTIAQEGHSELPDTLVIYSTEHQNAIEKISSIAKEYACDINVVNEDFHDLVFSKTLIKNKKNDSDSIGINLLQGKYLSGTYKQSAIPFKKTLIAVFLLVLCSQMFFMAYQWRTYNKRFNQLNSQLEALYFKTFPESKRLIDVRSQTQSKLEQLQQQSSDDRSFLRVLGVVGDEVRKNKSIKIQSLRFNDGILQLDMLSRGFIFNSLKQNLEKNYAMTVEERSSSREKEAVHSVISFKMK